MASTSLRRQTKRSRFPIRMNETKKAPFLEPSKLWCGPGLNRRHMDFQSIALPTELPHHPPIFTSGGKNSISDRKSEIKFYIPYSLKNLIRISLSCSQVKLPSESSCCATCRLLVSQLLK